jgi:superfamily II DNA or RNA helicase
MAELTITLGSHFFKITKISARARPAIESFARTLVQYGWQRERNKYIKAALRVFAIASLDRSEYRFHINHLRVFEQTIASFNLVSDMVAYDKLPIPDAQEVDLVFQPHWKLREHQIPVVDYLLSNDEPVSKFVSLQTGAGKSLVSMWAMSVLGLRTLIVVKPMYLEKWVEDLQRSYILEPEDIVVIRGSSQLMALLQLAENGDLTAKIIIISSKTTANWIMLYNKFMYQSLDMGYACIPDELCKLLRVGILLIDEVHQEFHANFKLLLNTNVFRSISLSATLISDDEFITKMQGVAYPKNLQYKGQPYKKYVDTTAVFFRFKEPEKLRCKDGISKNYSHHLFEQYVLRNRDVRKNYLNLIKIVFNGSYIENYKPGQKCLIFCISVDMCGVVRDFIQSEFKNLDVRRYCEDDPFENINIADVSVSTIQSAGTAVDVDKLSTVIMTTAISSSQANVQTLGRLRELKDGSTPKFLYFVCEDIDTHILYHEKKRAMLEQKAKTYKNIFIGNPL